MQGLSKGLFGHTIGKLTGMYLYFLIYGESAHLKQRRLVSTGLTRVGR